MCLDLLWAVRWLRRNPLFTAATVFVLALGIGANTAVFSIVDAVLLRPSPFPSPESLVRIEEGTTSRTVAGVQQPRSLPVRWSLPVNDYQRSEEHTSELQSHSFIS